MGRHLNYSNGLEQHVDWPENCIISRKFYRNKPKIIEVVSKKDIYTMLMNVSNGFELPQPFKQCTIQKLVDKQRVVQKEKTNHIDVYCYV